MYLVLAYEQKAAACVLGVVGQFAWRRRVCICLAHSLVYGGEVTYETGSLEERLSEGHRNKLRHESGKQSRFKIQISQTDKDYGSLIKPTAPNGNRAKEMVTECLTGRTS